MVAYREWKLRLLFNITLFTQTFTASHRPHIDPERDLACVHRHIVSFITQASQASHDALTIAMGILDIFRRALSAVHPKSESPYTTPDYPSGFGKDGHISEYSDSQGIHNLFQSMAPLNAQRYYVCRSIFYLNPWRFSYVSSHVSAILPSSISFLSSTCAQRP